MRIIVRGTNWVGDAVMTTPALRALRHIFPDAHIAIQTRSWAEGIFREADFIDEILAFDGKGSRFNDVLEQSKMLRQKKFDVAIIFPNSFEAALIPKLAGIPRRTGYSSGLRRLVLTHPIAMPEWKGNRHQVFYYLNLVSEVEKALCGKESVMEQEPSALLGISEERRRNARTFLTKSGADGRRKTVALGVGSANSRAKRWPVEYYAELNDLLQREMNVNVILLGAEDEQDVSRLVVETAKLKPIDLTGKTDLENVSAILSEIDLVVSNDMGLAHIAPAVGTETLVIFGPTDPGTTRPYSPRSTVISNPVECSPCMLRDCPIDHRCMARITVDQVFQHARAALTGASDRESVFN